MKKWGGDSFVAPRTDTERAVAKIWCEVLRVQRVGVFTNFFEAGGHSLTITKVISRIFTNLHADVPVSDAFEHPTVAGMASDVERILASRSGDSAAPAEADEVVPEDFSGEAPMTYNQQSMVYLSTARPEDAPLYNIALHGVLTGAFEIASLSAAFESLIERHPILRTTYQQDADSGDFVQVVHPSQDLDVNIMDFEDDLKMAEHAAQVETLRQEANRPFNLSCDSMMRVRFYRFPHSTVMQVVFHHIAVDLWSIALLFEELRTTLKKANIPDDATRRVFYSDYARHLRAQAANKRFVASAAYWKETLKCEQRELPLLDIPTDLPRPPTQTHHGALKTVTFEAADCKRMHDLCTTSNGTTMYVSLLSLLFTVLHKYTRQDEIVVGTPMGCRNVQKFESTVGYFINSVPVLQSFADVSKLTFVDVLSSCKQALLHALEAPRVSFPSIGGSCCEAKNSSAHPRVPNAVRFPEAAVPRRDHPIHHVPRRPLITTQ